ncbi:MAG TPA: DNA cytosine methyltransferase [Lacunisphaera sp.]|nr:DNA cytosine methyltransferase [Lacunisphaera sp.]
MASPVIDLFAGPGGLGEGFSSVLRGKKRRFKIKLSVEMDAHAHRTLELRAFVREFPADMIPADYYEYLSGQITRGELFGKYPTQAENAATEAWCAELGGKSAPEELLDRRIRVALGDAKQWVLIGGPPCQAYSLVGRSRVIGGKGQEIYDADPRHHLYKHYLRIIAEHRPPVFVMENVKGLLSAKVKEERIFDRILADLRNPGVAVKSAPKSDEDEYRLMPLVPTEGELLGGFYAPGDFIIRAEKFGIPQARHRLIILGIRSDIKAQPDLLVPQPDVTVSEAIGDLPRLRSGLSKRNDSGEAWLRSIELLSERPWFWSDALSDEVRKGILAATSRMKADLERGAAFIPADVEPKCHARWYVDPKLGGVCNHETRGHIPGDLHRYLFASVFAKVNGRSPQLEDFPKPLLPDHKNVKAALKETKFNDRFRVQLRDRPSTTVVSHISKDGHYYIHYDPTQCRSLTVREAARLQTFPDNYFFEGNRTQQYHQVGNAVPPLLARQIAEIVADLLEKDPKL